MPRIERSEILAKFKGMIERREPIIGGGAGTGLSAKCEEAGGIDLIVIYNSGRYRMMGHGSIAGMSYTLEVDMIAKASAHDMLTTPYVFSKEDAEIMTRAGADIIVCHMGLTTGGSIGAETALNLKDCVPIIDEWADAARSIRDDIIILCHGGPIAMPNDASFILNTCQNIQGFYGASSMERLPVEQALMSQTQKFKAITFID